MASLGDISILWRTTTSPTLSPILLVLLQIHVTHCGFTCSLYGEVGNETEFMPTASKPTAPHSGEGAGFEFRLLILAAGFT